MYDQVDANGKLQMFAQNSLIDALMLTSYIEADEFFCPPSCCSLPVCTSLIIPQLQRTYKTLARPKRVSLSVRCKSSTELHCLQWSCFDSSYRSTIRRPSFQAKNSLFVHGLSSILAHIQQKIYMPDNN